jgi:hypothetical protein
MTAVRALIAMTAPSGGAATRDRAKHFRVPPMQPGSVLFDEPIPLRADNVSHLEGRPVHLLCFLRRGVSCGAEIGSDSSGLVTACRCRCER